MTLKEKAEAAVELLKKEYPDALCSLVYTDPLQLLIATRLAAQCTDKRVNMVTPALFKKFPDAQSFSEAEPEEIENYIKSCGLYKTKARDISAMTKMLCDEYNGTVPDTIEELVKLPGIGRTSRLGFHQSKDAVKIEKLLRELLPPEESNDFCHRLVLHGRAVCSARKPDCENCCLKDICDSYNK